MREPIVITEEEQFVEIADSTPPAARVPVEVQITVSDPFEVGRYHSLAVGDDFPPEQIGTAYTTEDNVEGDVVMGVQYVDGRTSVCSSIRRASSPTQESELWRTSARR